jgi:DNA gyrase subunit A
VPVSTAPEHPPLVQKMLHGEAGHVNGDGASSVPPPPYAVALTVGGKVLRFALAAHAAVSTRKGRVAVRLDPGFPNDSVVGVEPTDGSETVCLATKLARVLIFPVTEANVVSGAAKGVIAIKLDPRDRVLGFSLANKMREGLTVRTNRGATMVVRATRYPVTGRGGRGYGVLQRGSLDAVIHDEATPVPNPEEVGE